MIDWPSISRDLSALVQVVFIDLALAGDNAIVVGLAVAGLPLAQRRRAIALGIAGATVIRIVLGAVTLSLLDVIGLTLAGGLLLLWVCYRMWRELRRSGPVADERPKPRKTLRRAMVQIILADVSMSLDNVLAVAGAARGSFWVLAVGLTVSILLMGFAAGLVARLLDRLSWLSWAGLAIVFYVALRMIWDGSHQVAAAV